MTDTQTPRRKIRDLAIKEATRRRLELPNHWAFVCGAQSYHGASHMCAETYKADFNAGYEWAMSLDEEV